MKKPLLLIVLLIGTLFWACKKSDQQPVAGSFIGKWKWLYTQGGIAGIKTTPATTGYNKTLSLNTDSTYVFMQNSNIIGQGSYHISADSRLEIAKRIDVITYSSMSVQQIISLKNDTLNLQDVYITDGTTSQYVRIK